MKKVVIYTFAILTISLLGSCKKFLAETSQDEIRPTTTQDLASLMYGTAYPYQTFVDNYIDLLTDDIKCNGVPLLAATGLPNATYTPYLTNGTPMFTFNSTMFDRTTAGLQADQDSWKTYYKLISGCNLIIDYIDKVTGSTTDKNAMLGQALFLRGYYYLKLVTIYAQPYSGAGIDATKSLGVPLVLSSVVSDVRLPRNTIAEVYTQIEKDLVQAADLLKNNYTAPNVFRVGHIAAYALLSRMYLYKGRADDMDKAIEYASNVINATPVLTDLKTYFSSTGTFGTTGIYDYNISREVIWCWGPNSTVATTYFPQASSFTGLTPPFTVSDELSNLYDKGTGTNNQGDLRYVSYFSKYTNGGTYALRASKVGTNASTQPYGDKGIRLAEVYLNRAEALILRFKKTAQQADLTQALSDLNYLRQYRYDTRNTSYVPVNITNADTLFTFCQQERRRELCLEEGHRWMDIKRWGLSITHLYKDVNGVATTYTLNANSPLYALPIPYTATENNYNLVQNPR